MNRTISLGLSVVAGCAIVLSFSALYNLALVCGFGTMLSALVPVMVDAGAAVASAVWLGSIRAARAARRFARALALALLSTTVIGNAVSHALVAYHQQPHWVVIVLVGALAPATLFATLYLRSLVTAGDDATKEVADLAERVAVDDDDLAVEVAEMVAEVANDHQPTARDLVLKGAGRTTLMKELGLTDHQARQAIREHRPATNGSVVH